MRQRTSCLAACLLLAATGCAHRTWIRSNPPGASVYVGDQFVGLTPCLYSTPASQLRDHTPVRIERPGYQTAQGELQTAVLPSRIVGGLFTLGLVPLFKQPHTYHSQHTFTLRPLTRADRLAQLDDRHWRGEGSDAECRDRRCAILAGP
jgi:hypothetical protein